MAFLETQNAAEANAILDPAIIHDQPNLLYASARLAQLSGDNDRARQLACQALEKIEAGSPDSPKSTNTSSSLFYQLAQLSLLLDLAHGKIRAADRCP